MLFSFFMVFPMRCVDLLIKKEVIIPRPECSQWNLKRKWPATLAGQCCSDGARTERRELQSTKVIYRQGRAALEKLEGQVWVDTGNRIVAALNSASFQVAATMRLNLGRAALRRLVAALPWVTHAGRASAG